MDPTLITEEVEDTLEFSDTILNVQLGIRNFLGRKRDIEVQHPVSQFQMKSIAKEIPAPRAHVKLPEISIKTFSGDPLKLLTFWDSFGKVLRRDDFFRSSLVPSALDRTLRARFIRFISWVFALFNFFLSCLYIVPLPKILASRLVASLGHSQCSSITLIQENSLQQQG